MNLCLSISNNLCIYSIVLTFSLSSLFHKITKFKKIPKLKKKEETEKKLDYNINKNFVKIAGGLLRS